MEDPLLSLSFRGLLSQTLIQRSIWKVEILHRHFVLCPSCLDSLTDFELQSLSNSFGYEL